VDHPRHPPSLYKVAYPMMGHLSFSSMIAISQ
jgi:hypothetical protein